MHKFVTWLDHSGKIIENIFQSWSHTSYNSITDVYTFKLHIVLFDLSCFTFRILQVHHQGFFLQKKTWWYWQGIHWYSLTLQKNTINSTCNKSYLRYVLITRMIKFSHFFNPNSIPGKCRTINFIPCSWCHCNMKPLKICLQLNLYTNVFWP